MSAAPPPPPAASAARREIALVLRLSAAASWAASAAAFSGGSAWWCELVTHWSAALAGAEAALAVLLLVARSPRCSVATLLVAAATAAPVAAALRDGGEAGADRAASAAAASRPAPPLVVLEANLAYFSPDAAPVVPWILGAKPDVVVALETTAKHHATLAPLRADLPEIARADAVHDAGSLAVFSRLPLVDPEAFTPAGPLPQLQVDVLAPLGRVRLVAVHAFPPISESAAGWNRAVVADVARRARAADAAGIPFVAVGDFNLAPWSPTFRGFLAESGLVHGRRGRGFANSWPEGPLFPLLGIPIDHVLVARRLRIDAFEIGPYVASDHRGFVARVAAR